MSETGRAARDVIVAAASGRGGTGKIVVTVSLALSATVHLAGLELGVPGSLTWAVLPVALAVSLIGLCFSWLNGTLEGVVLTGLKG